MPQTSRSREGYIAECFLKLDKVSDTDTEQAHPRQVGQDSRTRLEQQLTNGAYAMREEVHRSRRSPWWSRDEPRCDCSLHVQVLMLPDWIPRHEMEHVAANDALVVDREPCLAHPFGQRPDAGYLPTTTSCPA